MALSEKAKMLRNLRRALRKRGYTLSNSVLFDIQGQNPLPSAIENALQKLAAPPEPEYVQWRCFHCDEVFDDPEVAREHFGSDQTHTPACKIAPDIRGLIAIIREKDRELESFRNEDDNSSRFFYEISSKHGQELRRAEEKGYARGLEDGRKIPRN